MELIKHIRSLRSRLRELRLEDKSLGLVPTMGALHIGHISLVEASIKENDFTAASLFVNPTQFNNKEDYEKYPSSIERDLEMFEAAGVDLVFMPSAQEMYPEESVINLDFGQLAKRMEGNFRPGHFNGVGLVVSKLFNLFQPDKAYFGQKDLQQYMIIHKLNEELKFGIDIRMLPTIREENGLAMSSRNRRLSSEGIIKASLISRSLQQASKLLHEGNTPEMVKNIISEEFNKDKLQLEYFEIVNREDLSPVSQTNHSMELAVCIACYVDGVRLIDNTLLTLR